MTVIKTNIIVMIFIKNVNYFIGELKDGNESKKKNLKLCVAVV